MARHAKDLDACLEVSKLWERLTIDDDVFIFNVGDTVYTIRGIDSYDARYIIDSQSSIEFKEDSTRVRYLLDKDFEIWSVKYILKSSLLNTRCPICSGFDVKFDYSCKGDVCEDCGNIVDVSVKPNKGRLYE